MYKGSTIRSTANLSPEAMESRRKWDDIFKSAKRKKKKKKSRIQYLAKLSKIREKLRHFQMRDLITNRSFLKEMLKSFRLKQKATG